VGSHERARKANAARNRAYWQRKRQAAEPVPVTAPVIASLTAAAATPPDDPVGDYLRSVIVWARATRTPTAGRLASTAAGLLEKVADIKPSNALAFARLTGVGMPTIEADNLIRNIANENIALAAETIAGGRAEPADVRAGLQAASTLIRNQPKVDGDAAANAFWRAVFANGAMPPAHLLDEGDPSLHVNADDEADDDGE
jgi:hypothetical protein